MKFAPEISVSSNIILYKSISLKLMQLRLSNKAVLELLLINALLMQLKRKMVFNKF